MIYTVRLSRAGVRGIHGWLSFVYVALVRILKTARESRGRGVILEKKTPGASRRHATARTGSIEVSDFYILTQAARCCCWRKAAPLPTAAHLPSTPVGQLLERV